MDYSIDIRGNITAEIRTSLLKLISSIEDEFAFREPEIDESLHKIRIAQKKIRAILLLIREEIGYSSYLREKSIYRDIAKALSAYRDRDVFLNLADKMDHHFRDEMGYSCLKRLIDRLRTDKQVGLDQLRSNVALIGSFKQSLNSGKLAIENTSLQENSLTAMIGGLKRTYKKCRHALTACKESTTEYSIHELRKILKFLGYQVRFIKQVNPVICKAYAKSLDIVCEFLGEINDYAEFKNFYNQSTARGLSRSNRQVLDTLIDDLTVEKLGIALPQARMALIEKPSDFANRIAGYWDVTVSLVQ